MKLQDKLLDLKHKDTALLATNFYNFETLSGSLQAAAALNTPLILQVTRSSIEYMGLDVTVGLARSALKQYGVEGWLHLDHADSYDLIKQCLEAGFDSVMIDASEKPFDENVEITSSVVELAAKFDANVEAELGYVAKLGQSKEKVGFTEPSEAKEFVDATGVNALAVAIGTAHGFYTKEPKLDLKRLEKINEATEAALVLHGGSGVPSKSLQESIQRGICKINLATEIKNIFMSTLKDTLDETDEIDLRKVFPHATTSITELVKGKLEIVTLMKELT